MMKIKIFKALALALLSHALISGPADAEKFASCPAFNSAMVDAAAMASDLLPDSSSFVVFDDPKVPMIKCEFDTVLGAFRVKVNIPEDLGAASVAGANGAGDDTLLRAGQGALSLAELHACRQKVLQSFVWNRHCAAFLP